MIGKEKWQEMTRKRKKGKGREIPTTEMSATTKKKKYPVLYSFHFICSTVVYTQYSSKYLFFKSESGI